MPEVPKQDEWYLRDLQRRALYDESIGLWHYASTYLACLTFVLMLRDRDSEQDGSDCLAGCVSVEEAS